jgi:hypothetical protein
MIVAMATRNNGGVVEVNGLSNKSMERRRKQRLSYQPCLFTFSLRVAGFRLAHLNRSALSCFMGNNFMTQKKILTLIVLTIALVFVACSKNASSQSNKTSENSSKSSEKTNTEAENKIPKTPFSLSEQIQPRFKNSNGYLRSSIIEKVPANEQRPFLKYLDAGRAASEEGMRLLVAGKYDDFYKSTSKVFKNQYTQEQFNQLIQAFEQAGGKIVSYEYRNQAIEYPSGTFLTTDFSKATANTVYAIKLSKIEGDGFFMDVETTVENGKHVISFITTQNYGGNIPPWLINTNVSTSQKKNI